MTSNGVEDEAELTSSMAKPSSAPNTLSPSGHGAPSLAPPQQTQNRDPLSTSQQSASSSRRPRAPTINIDTSAVSMAPPLDSGSDSFLQPGASPATYSRPTSAHNVSMSPTAGPDGKQPQLLLPPDSLRHGSWDNAGDLSPTSIGGPTLPGSGSLSDASKIETHNNDAIMTDKDALKPDEAHKADFDVPNNPFAWTPGELNKMLNPKSLSAFYALGGAAGLEKGLRTDVKSGLSLDENAVSGAVTREQARAASSKSVGSLEEASDEDSPQTQSSDFDKDLGNDRYTDRKRVYSDNKLPPRKPKSFWYLVWAAYNDKMIILLSGAAAISLALGIYESVHALQTGDTDIGNRVAWVEGVAIIVAILIVVSAGALNDWKKEKQFAKLNKIKEDRKVTVTRSGHLIDIQIDDILVGDLVRLEAGDILPADGIVVSGYSITCDESSATGESDQLRKTPADIAWKAIVNGESLRKIDPFIISGAQVTEGVGTFIVTSTGVNSSHGKLLMSLQEEPGMTPLQSKLNTLAEYIAKLGLTAGILLFTVTAIQYGIRVSQTNIDAAAKGQQFLRLFIVAVTVIVVAVPEGLPLAVTLALSFATTRMLKDNNLVRRMQACETMGNATTVCSDKTGTLTQNNMKVVNGTIGLDNRFAPKIEQIDGENHNAEKTTENTPTSAEAAAKMSKDVSELLKQSIVLNSTAFEAENNSIVGSKTEVALLQFAKEHLGVVSIKEERSIFKPVQLIPFDSKRKCMGTVIKVGNVYRLLVKGASELMLEQCTSVIQDQKPLSDGSLPLDKQDHKNFLSTIESYASKSLRTIGILYQDFEQWPPANAQRMADNPEMAVFEDIFQDMTLIGIVGIKDPLREGVPQAVKDCQKAGVTVRMVTGDNLLTAKAIARDCGILTDDNNIMEGIEFRNLSQRELDERVPTLQVLARSSPEDKKLLVQRLQALGNIVAVTGDGTNDAPALNTADVGFSMGIAGTEVAKMASDIILMDDNFSSIVNAILWGRAVNDAVKKFLQFQVTVNITAVVLTFISAVSSEDQSSILSAVQLLWVNLIMDTLAALALATDPPSRKLLDRKPDKRNASLITTTMWKMIIGQAIFQLVVTLTLYYGKDRFPIYGGDYATSGSIVQQESALIFNTFVFAQIFNQYNSRRLDNGYNIFEGILKNYYFLAIQLVIVGGQVLIMFVGSFPFGLYVRLTGLQWGVSIILGMLSIPWAILIRTVPDEFVAIPCRAIWRIIPSWMKHLPWFYIKKLFGRNKKNQKDVEAYNNSQVNGLQWHEGIEEIHDSLSFVKWIHGGRLRQVRSKMGHPLDRFRKVPKASPPPTPARTVSRPGSSVRSHRSNSGVGRPRNNSGVAAAVAMSGIVGGAIAGWHATGSATSEHPPPSVLTHDVELKETKDTKSKE